MITPFYWDSNMFTFAYLKDMVKLILNCFTDIWSFMCSPFIPEYNYTTSGGNYLPYWSILIPIIAIGTTFCMIILAKKIIFMFLERGDSHV